MKQSIVNQAMLNCKMNTIEVLLAQITGDLKGNPKIVQTSRLSGFIGGNPNDGAQPNVRMRSGRAQDSCGALA